MGERKITPEEELQRLNGGGSSPTSGKGMTPMQELEKLNQQYSQNQGSPLGRDSSVRGSNTLQPLDYSPDNLEYLKGLDFGEKADRSWNAGWGSVKSSMGAGMEWIGIENDIKSLEEFGRNLKDKGNVQSQQNYMPMKDFEWEDLLTENFWSVKAPTILPSMISLMGPSVMSGIAGTVATETALGALWPAALAEPTPIGEIALGTAGAIGGLVGAATTSRALEGIMEAGGTWSEIVQRLEEKGMSTEDAQKVAGAQAANVYKRNWALVGLDAMEFAMMVVPLKGIGAGMRSAKMGAKLAKRYGRNTAVPESFKKAGRPIVESMMNNAKVLKRASDAVPTGIKVTAAMLTQGAMEGSEELWQAWIGSQAINVAEGKPEESFEEFWSRPETKEAAVLGAIGGIAMQGLGSAAGGIQSKIRGNAEKKVKEAQKKTKRTMQFMDDLANEKDPVKQEGLRVQFAVESIGNIVADGKGEQLRAKFDSQLKNKQISKETYDQNMPFINKFINNFDSIGTEFKPQEKSEIIKLIATKSALEMKMEASNENAEKVGVDPKIQEALNKIELNKISKIDEQLDMILNPEKYEEEAKEGKPGKTKEAVRKEAFKSVASEEEEEVEFEDPPPTPQGYEPPTVEPIQSTPEFVSQKNDTEVEEIETDVSNKDTIVQKNAIAAARSLKRGNRIKGQISRPSGKRTSFLFTDEQGKEYEFFDHGKNIKDEDITKPAHLQIIEPKKGETYSGKKVVEKEDGTLAFKYPSTSKTYPYEINVVGPNGKKFGNLRQSTTKEFSQQQKEQREKASKRTAKHKGKTLERIEEINTESQYFELSPDQRNYIYNRPGHEMHNKSFTRVTDNIGKKYKENAFTESSQTIGSNIDLLVRDFFSGKLKPYSEYTNQDGSPFILEEKEHDKFITQLGEIKSNMNSRGEKVFASGIILHNEKMAIAGEVDILTIDDDQNVRIYDMKTMRKDPDSTYKSKPGQTAYESEFNGGISSKEAHTRQLNLYRILLNNTYGILAKTVAVMPIKVYYQAGDITTSQAEILKGRTLENRDRVLDNELDITEHERDTFESDPTGYVNTNEKKSNREQVRKERKARIDKKIDDEIANLKEALNNPTAGIPLHALEPLVKIALLQFEKGIITFQEFKDKMIKLLHKNGMIDKLGQYPNGVLKQLYDAAKEAKITEATDKMFNSMAEAKGMEGVDSEVTVDNVIQRFDSQMRTAEDINKVHDLLKPFQEATGMPHNESIGYLYQLTHEPNFNEGDIKGSLERLNSYGGEAKRLGDFLDKYDQGKLVSLMVTIKSLHSLPVLYYNNPSRKNSSSKNYFPLVANKSSDLKSRYTITAKNTLSNIKAEDVRKNLIFFENTRQKALDAYSLNPNPDTRYAIVEKELEFLKFHTGLDWGPFLENPKYRQKSATYKEHYWLTRDKFEGSALYNFILSKRDGGRVVLESKEELEENILSSNQIGTLVDQMGDPNKINYGITFRGVSGNLLYGLIESSDIIEGAKSVINAKGKAVDENPMVQYWKGKKRNPQIFMTDGIRNDYNRFGKSMGDLSAKDLWTILLTNFGNNTPVSEGHYIQNIEQLGDKSTNIMVEAKRYSTEEAAKEIESISKSKWANQLPSKAEDEAEIKVLKEVIKDLMQKNVIPREDIQALAESFYDNYKINKIYNDLYYFGNNYNNHIDQVKRAGSSASNGKIGNREIEGGLGKELKYVVLEDPTKDLKSYHGNLKEPHKVTDGNMYISEAFSKKNNVSYGSIYDYHTSLKAIYSNVDWNTGDRTLLKSHAIILNDDLVAKFPSLKEYKDILDGGVDIISFESSAKKHPKGMLTIDSKKPKVITGSTEHWRMQNDLRQTPELKPRKMPIQLARHLMQFNEGHSMQELFNEAMNVNAEEFNKMVVGNKEIKKFRDFLLGRIPDTDRNREMRDYLNSEMSVLHKYIGKMSAVTFASAFEKRVLDMKVNGALYTPIPLPGVEMKPYRIENGVGVAGESYVPAGSKLKGKDYFATRVPSSGMHSTAYLNATGELPASLGNVMAIPVEMTAIAGEDHDGDQRHTWGEFQNPSGKVPQEKANEAFAKLRDLYQLKSAEDKELMFEKLTDPISIENTKNIIKKYNKKKSPNKQRPSTFIKTYNDNKDSGKMISIAARSNATYSWLKSIKARLQESLIVPVFKDGKVFMTRTLSQVSEGIDIDRTNAANLNISLDNLKEQMLEVMGLNDHTGTVFIALEQFGLNEASIIELMNQKVIRDYITYIRDNASEINPSNSNRSFNDFAERLVRGSTNKGGLYKSLMSGTTEITADWLNKSSDENRDLAFLSVMNKATYAFSTYREVARFTRLTEKSIRSFPEYYQAKKIMDKVLTPKSSTGNDRGMDLSSFKSLPQTEPAKVQLEMMDAYYNSFTAYNSPRAKSYIKAFEKMYARVLNKVIPAPIGNKFIPNDNAPMPNDKMESLVSTIDNILIGEYFEKSKNKSQSRRDANRAFRELKAKDENNEFISILEIEDGKLVVAKGLRTADQSQKIEEIRYDFEKLRKSDPELINDIVYYDLLEFGFSPLYRNGSISYFFSIPLHVEIGESMEESLSKWNKEKFFEVPESQMNAIMKQNPSMIQAVRLESHNDFGEMHIESNQGIRVDPRFNPKYVIQYVGGKPVVHTRQNSGEKSFYDDEHSQLLEDFSAGAEATDQELNDEVKFQYISEDDGLFSVPEQENTEVRDYIMQRMNELFPDVKQFSDPKLFEEYVNKHVGPGKTVLDMSALGASFKDSIYINPDKAIQTTRLHEYAHLYFDALRTKDPKMAKMMLDLFQSDEEAMIEAIAQAGVDMTKVKLQGNLKQRFTRILQMFWARVKALFGMTNKKEAAMAFVDRMMNNQDRFTMADFHAKVVKMQGNVKENPEEAGKRLTAIMEAIKQKYPDFEGGIKDVTHGIWRHLIVGLSLSGQEGDNFKTKTFLDLYKSARPYKVREDGIGFIPLSIHQYTVEKHGPNVNYSALNANNKQVIQDAYDSYIEQHAKVEEMWKRFDTEEKWEKLIQDKKKFKGELIYHIRKLEDIDNVASGHLKHALMMELETYETLQKVKGEIGEENQLYTRMAYDLIVTREAANDLHESDLISGKYSMLSPQGAKSFLTQARQKELQDNGQKIFDESDEHVGRISEIRKEIEKLVKKDGQKSPFKNPTKEEIKNHPLYRMDNNKLAYRDIIGSTIYSSKVEKLLGQWLSKYKASVTEFDHSQDGKDVYYVPMVESDFFELFSHIQGDMKDYRSYIKSFAKTVLLKASSDISKNAEGSLDENYVFGINRQPTMLREYKEQMIKNAKTDIQKLNAARKIAAKTRWITYQSKTKGGRDALGNFIKVSIKDPSISTGVGFGQDELSSNNLGIVAERHISGIVEKHNLVELSPKLIFYRDFMNRNSNENYARWMQMMDDKLLYGKNPSSVFGRYGDYIQWLVNFTAWRFLAINPLAAQFNAMAGITQTATHYGVGPILKGIRRIVKDMKVVDGSLKQKFDQGFVSSIGIRFMQSIKAVNTSQDTELSITSKVGNIVSNIAFSPITFVEYINHAYTTIGLMSDSEWEATKIQFNENSDLNIMTEAEFKAEYGKSSSQVLNSQKIDELLDNSRRIHGAYHPFNKRMVNSTIEGRMVMQFKNWLPDVVLAHFQNEYTDMNGVIRKGILTSVVSSPALDLYKSVFTGSPEQMRKKYQALPDIDKANSHKFMRELIMIGSISMLIASLGEGEDRKKKDLNRIMGDVGFIYDIDNAKFIFEGPAPILGTVVDLLDVSRDVTRTITGSEAAKYQRDAKYGKKGEFKAPIKIMNLLPAHRVIKEIWYE